MTRMPRSGADPIKQSEQSLARVPAFITPKHFGSHFAATDFKLADSDGQSIVELTLMLFDASFCKEAKSWRVEIP